MSLSLRRAIAPVFSLFGLLSTAIFTLPGSVGYCQAGSRQAQPDIRVDYFGAEKGYAVGTADVVMLCVLRNVGTADLPANSLRLRCYTLAGFDYTEGELTPLVPALAPRQAVSFRWRLQPTDPGTPLVASVLLSKVEDRPTPAPVLHSVGPHAVVVKPESNKQEATGGDRSYTPHAVISLVPHLSSSPPDAGVGSIAPAAIANANSVKIGNDRISLRLMPTETHGALALISAKTPNGWETAGVAWPLAEIRASIDGQSPWERRFRWTQSEAHATPGISTLTLYGTCGDEWEVQLQLESRKDSGALNGRLRLKARKTARLYGVQLPRLISASDRVHPLPPADGSASLISTSPVADETENLAAAHRGSVTFGIAWPARPPLPDWLPFPLPSGDTDHTVQLGMKWNGGDRGEVVLPGGIVDFSFSLFCLSPSDTARDAHKFVLP